MRTLIFDIETLGEDFDAMDEITQDALTHWIKQESETDAEYAHMVKTLKDGMGFSPLTGEIVAIAMLDYEQAKRAVYFQAPESDLTDFEEEEGRFRVMDEAGLLAAFWEAAKSYDQFITFNGRSFDVPFLMMRSAVHKVHPTRNLMSNRYVSSQFSGAKHIDLLDQLSFYGAVRRKGSLHLYCRAFGIKSPKADGVTGNDVARLFHEKKYLDIARYNIRDIEATGELYTRWREYISM